MDLSCLYDIAFTHCHIIHFCHILSYPVSLYYQGETMNRREKNPTHQLISCIFFEKLRVIIIFEA